MLQPRIFGRVDREAFIGRDAELRQILRHASGTEDARVLALGVQPDAGGSELVRQAYDQLFLRRANPVPVYFRFTRGDGGAIDTARRFFQTFLQQFIAYRRVEPSLCQAQLTLNDLLELSPPGDYQLISTVVAAYRREELSTDNLSTLCLSLPHRFAIAGRDVFPLIDCLKLRTVREDVALAHKLIVAVEGANIPLLVAGPRRLVNDLLNGFDNGEHRPHATLHVDRLSDDRASRVIDVLSAQRAIEIDDATRDLIVQQLNARPSLIAELLEAASEKQLTLSSFRQFGQLYADELLGGRLKRHFDRLVELAVLDHHQRRLLVRMLYESVAEGTGRTPLSVYQNGLGLSPADFDRAINVLHISELVNADGVFIEVNTRWTAWLDYLRVQYRLEVGREPRAQVVAATVIESLKRTPQTMARKYRRDAALSLEALVTRFDCQDVPASLFHYDRFAALYRGEESDAIQQGLSSESELMQLPQIVQAATCSSFNGTMSCDTERCLVAHGFERGDYANDSEIVWLCAEIDSKLEASRDLTAEWCNRLAAFAHEHGCDRFQTWLIAPEGFSREAGELLNELGAFGSSHQQFGLLKSRLSTASDAVVQKLDEFEMVLPMSTDTEIIAARTAEQIARRVKFAPDAINQIKTAVVEACINAAEHSLSPDRKIYQRFVVEDDRLVITVASRGVLPSTNGNAVDPENGNGRRGWGLKLIKTLMDEVEFERVDDGTQLKMTKYRNKEGKS